MSVTNTANPFSSIPPPLCWFSGPLLLSENLNEATERKETGRGEGEKERRREEEKRGAPQDRVKQGRKTVILLNL